MLSRNPFGVLDFGSVGSQDGPIRVSNRWSLGIHRWTAELSELRPFFFSLQSQQEKGSLEKASRQKSCRENRGRKQVHDG